MPLLTDTLHALRRAARTPRLVLLLWGAHLAIAAVAFYPALRFLEKWLANAPAGDEFLRRFSLPLFADLMRTGGKWGDGLGQLLSVVLVNLAVHRANSLDIRLADWAHAAVPLSLLALSGLLISRFDLGLAPVPDLAGAATAFLLFAAFAGCGLALSLREYRRYRAVL